MSQRKSRLAQRRGYSGNAALLADKAKYGPTDDTFVRYVTAAEQVDQWEVVLVLDCCHYMFLRRRDGLPISERDVSSWQLCATCQEESVQRIQQLLKERNGGTPHRPLR